MVTERLVPLLMINPETTRPWRFMLFGSIGSGKTTLLRALEGKDPRSARKSQMVDYSGWGIDTPGEYSEIGRMRRVLVTTAFDAQVLVVLQDASSDQIVFPPHYFLMFPQRTIGVVNKIDLKDADLERAGSLLQQAGVTGNIFYVSAVTGEGVSALREYLLNQKI
jgi:ethanolamine utilization protein EutP